MKPQNEMTAQLQKLQQDLCHFRPVGGLGEVQGALNVLSSLFFAANETNGIFPQHLQSELSGFSKIIGQWTAPILNLIHQLPSFLNLFKNFSESLNFGKNGNLNQQIPDLLGALTRILSFNPEATSSNQIAQQSKLMLNQFNRQPMAPLRAREEAPVLAQEERSLRQPVF